MANLDINKISKQLGSAKDAVGKIGDMPKVKKFAPERLQKKMGNLGKSLGSVRQAGKNIGDIKTRADKMPKGEDRNKMMLKEGLGQLKTLADQRSAARQLQRSRPPAERGSEMPQDEDIDMEDENYLAETIGSFQRVIKQEGRLAAIKEGLKLGVKLRKGMKKTSFKAFTIVLVLAVIKDAWDLISVWFDLGLTGAIVNIFISVALFVIIFWQGTFIKRIMLKRFIWPIIVEYIPVISAFPTYTIAILLLKMKLDRKRRKFESANNDLERELVRLQKVRIK